MAENATGNFAKHERIAIDGYMQGLRLNSERIIKESPNAVNALNEVHHSLLLSKAWYGKMLQEFGSTTPYKNDGNRTSKKDIEETDSQYEGELYEESNIIVYVDSLRQMIQNSIEVLETETKKISFNPKGVVATRNVYTHLCNARMYLGFVLQAIKEERDPINLY